MRIYVAIFAILALCFALGLWHATSLDTIASNASPPVAPKAACPCGCRASNGR